MKAANVGVLIAGLVASCQPVRSSGSQEIAAVGLYVHAPSGLRFPERVGEFRRERILQHDATGRDVGVGYNLEAPGRMMAATVYVYPLSPRSFDDELASVKNAHSAFALAFEQELVLERDGQKRTCQLASFSYEEVFAHQFGPVGSYLLVCDRKPWRIKWRLTHRASADRALTEMKELAAALTVQE